MKLRHLGLAAAFLIATVFASAETFSYKETFSRTAAFQSDGQLSLRNVNGNIQVETWDKNEILIEGEKFAGSEEDLKRIDLRIEISPSRAEAVVLLPRKSGLLGQSIKGAVTFHIKVPVHTTIDEVKSVNSDIQVTGVAGNVRLETVNGQIRAEQLGANAHLETVNGQIRADFETVGSGQKLTCKTINGAIQVGLPSDTGARVKATVVNGQVQSAFDVDGKSSKRGKRLSGTIGDGRAELDANSINGDIRLAKR